MSYHKALVSEEYDEMDDQTSSSPPGSPPLQPPPLRRETTADYLPPLELPPRPEFFECTAAQGSPSPITSEIENTCIFCKKAFYTDQAFKTACPDCYEAKRRKCECGKNLPIDAPSFKTKCTTCWIEERKKTHEVCPTCTGARSVHLRKRKDKKECLDCYRRNKEDAKRTTRRSTREESRRTSVRDKKESKSRR